MALERFERGLQNQLQNARWMSADKTNRQQIAKQNALRDIQQQSAQLGLQQGQDKQAFMEDSRTLGVENALKKWPIVGRQLVAQHNKQGLSKSFEPVQMVDSAGNISLYAPSYNPNTNSATLQPYNTPEGQRYMKETPQEKRTGKVKEKKEILKVETAAAEEKELRKVTGTRRANRWATQVDDAYDSIEALPIIKRNIELINLVETGGIDKAKILAKQYLGVESANEAELAQNIGKAVLKQLKPTFGAQFTVKEGEELKSIEAGLGKSTKGNKRLLNQALQIYTRVAKRGLNAAKRSKDTDAFDAITEGMNYKFEEPKEQIVDYTEDDIQETMRANNMTREAVLSRLGGK